MQEEFPNSNHQRWMLPRKEVRASSRYGAQEGALFQSAQRVGQALPFHATHDAAHSVPQPLILAPVEREVVLSLPSILLVNFEGHYLDLFEELLQACIPHIHPASVDIYNLGSSRTRLSRLSGTAAAVSFLRFPHPGRDPRGFAWARQALDELNRRRLMRVVPVWRETDHDLAYFRSIVSICPFYISLVDDFEHQRRMMKVMLDSMI